MLSVTELGADADLLCKPEMMSLRMESKDRLGVEVGVGADVGVDVDLLMVDLLLLGLASPCLSVVVCLEKWE